jgi:hypothetical protein
MEREGDAIPSINQALIFGSLSGLSDDADVTVKIGDIRALMARYLAGRREEEAAAAIRAIGDMVEWGGFPFFDSDEVCSFFLRYAEDSNFKLPENILEKLDKWQSCGQVDEYRKKYP